MNKRKGIIAVLVIVVSLGLLMVSAVSDAAKEVVTVTKLVEGGQSRRNVRLGARLTETEIRYQTSPTFLVEFAVRDIIDGSAVLPVRYQGVMPDTLKPGRDVILEGDFQNGQFTASSLQTQCPSKYEPPKVPSNG